MFSAFLSVYVILLGVFLVDPSPIAFDIVHITKSNFTPVVIDNIRNKLEYQVSPTESKVPLSNFQPKIKGSSIKLGSTATTSIRGYIKFFDSENVTLEDGSLCKRTSDGASGYCIKITQCQHVFKEFRMFGTKIDVCGYDGGTPIVCCPLATRTGEKRKLDSKKRVSARYCEQHSESGTARGEFIRLVNKPAVVEKESVPVCRFHLPLIVGGESVSPGEFPHMAAIGWTRQSKPIKWMCGGSLISEYFVLTAAHCGQVRGVPPDVIRLGAHNLCTTEEEYTKFEDFRIEKIINHPEYRQNAFYNDIALFELNRAVQFNQFIRPACLWQSPELTMSEAIATGWGRLSFRGRKAKDLQKVVLDLIDHETCNNSVGLEDDLKMGITDSQICAAHMEGGKDTCQGDSGGPLQVLVPNHKCTYYVIGITSFGRFCATPNTPGIYTNVYYYLDWIEKIVFQNK